MFKAALITLLVVATQADEMCDHDGHYLHGYCYWFAPLKEYGTWSDAGRDCRYLSPKAHLYRPSSLEQQENVTSLLMSQYNMNNTENWYWAIDFNKLLDGVQWLNTDFSVPKYDQMNDAESDGLCGLLMYSEDVMTLLQGPGDCGVHDVKAICQKKMCSTPIIDIIEDGPR